MIDKELKQLLKNIFKENKFEYHIFDEEKMKIFIEKKKHDKQKLNLLETKNLLEILFDNEISYLIDREKNEIRIRSDKVGK